MQFQSKPNGPSLFWRNIGWLLLIGGMAFLAFAAMQDESNPAVVMVYIATGPFAIFGLALVVSRTARGWMVKPVERPSHSRRR